MCYNKKQRGYIVLISVLVVGAIGAALALSLVLLSLSSSRTSFVSEQSLEAMALVNACAEEALQQIRDSVSFAGYGNITLGDGSCSYAVTSGGGQNRTIAASGAVNSIVRKVKVTIIKINPTISISSWQEVPDL